MVIPIYLLFILEYFVTPLKHENEFFYNFTTAQEENLVKKETKRNEKARLQRAKNR